MTQLCLENFADHQKRYIVDNPQDVPFVLKPLLKNACVPSVQGFCSIRKTGLFRRKKTVIAVFSDGQSLRMNIGDAQYILSDEDVVAKRTSLFPLAKKFAIIKGLRTLMSLLYWDTESGDWSDDSDIFCYAERITRSLQNKADFLYILNALRSGEDLGKPAFLEKMKRDLGHTTDQGQ